MSKPKWSMPIWLLLLFVFWWLLCVVVLVFNQDPDAMIRLLLIATGACIVLGALLAWWWREYVRICYNNALDAFGRAHYKDVADRMHKIVEWRTDAHTWMEEAKGRAGPMILPAHHKQCLQAARVYEHTCVADAKRWNDFLSEACGQRGVAINDALHRMYHDGWPLFPELPEDPKVEGLDILV